MSATVRAGSDSTNLSSSYPFRDFAYDSGGHLYSGSDDHYTTDSSRGRSYWSRTVHQPLQMRPSTIVIETSELPSPYDRVFAKFTHFNAVQSASFEDIFQTVTAISLPCSAD